MDLVHGEGGHFLLYGDIPKTIYSILLLRKVYPGCGIEGCIECWRQGGPGLREVPHRSRVE